MRHLSIIISGWFMLTISTFSDDASLLKQIEVLNKRVTALEEQLAPVLEQERVKIIARQKKERAHERMMMDADLYSRHDLNIIEKLYDTARQDWESADAIKAVTILTERYPRANRTGCAVLTLAQSIEGDEQLKYLKLATEKYRNCYYSSGVQVGPYAQLYLAMLHKKSGRDKEASRLFNAIRARFPNEIDHKGQLLTSHLEGMD